MEKCGAGFPVPCSGREPWQSIWRSCELSIQQKEPGFPSIPILTQSSTLTREVRERYLFCALRALSSPLYTLPPLTPLLWSSYKEPLEQPFSVQRNGFDSSFSTSKGNT